MPWNSAQHRHDLRAIARRVMIERGFLPDFSPAVKGEVDGDPNGRHRRRPGCARPADASLVLDR